MRHTCSITAPITAFGDGEAPFGPARAKACIMRSPLVDQGSIAIRSHCCPACSGPMILTLTKPSGIGSEMRVFQGVNCDHVDRIIAETKSMSWASSWGLQAPD